MVVSLFQWLADKWNVFVCLVQLAKSNVITNVLCEASTAVHRSCALRIPLNTFLTLAYYALNHYSSKTRFNFNRISIHHMCLFRSHQLPYFLAKSKLILHLDLITHNLAHATYLCKDTQGKSSKLSTVHLTLSFDQKVIKCLTLSSPFETIFKVATTFAVHVALRD